MIVIGTDIKLSVIVPVYNVEKHLKNCMDSILSAQSEAYEIILVDDGSTDGSPAICDDYQRRFAHVRVVHRENGGLATARNTGIGAAKGEYVTFVDSDDVVDKGYIDSAQAYLGEDDILVFPYAIDYPETGSSREKRIPDATSVSAAEAVRTLEQHNAFNMVWNKLYRREMLLREPQALFEPYTEPAEDLLFNCRCFTRARTVTLVNRLFYHWIRRGEDTLANRFRKDLIEKNKGFIEERNRLYRALSLYDTDFPLLAKGNLAYVYMCIPNMYRGKNTFPRKERIAFYKELLASEEVARWMASVEIRDALMKQFARLYRRKSAFWMDAGYYTATWMRRRFDGLWQIVRKKIMK